VLSLYGQDAWNPTGRVGVTAGLRIDRYTDFGIAASPRLAAVFRARPDLNLKASYGRAVRVPSFLELLYSSPRTTADPGLEPARLHSVDLGAVWRRRDLRLSATVYRTLLRDLIAPLGSGFTVGAPAPIANVAGIDDQGLELEASRSFSGNRMVQAWLAFQHPEDEATGDRLADAPSRLFRVTGLLPAGEYLLISPTLAWHGGRPRAEGDPRPDLDGYTLVDVVVRARNFHPRLELAGSIQNLFDVRYADPSPLGGLPDDYPRPGRAVFLKVKYRF
jgi:iron complex outermembrane receptor protein